MTKCILATCALSLTLITQAFATQTNPSIIFKAGQNAPLTQQWVAAQSLTLPTSSSYYTQCTQATGCINVQLNQPISIQFPLPFVAPQFALSINSKDQIGETTQTCVTALQSITSGSGVYTVTLNPSQVFPGMYNMDCTVSHS